ncbi:helix-turn-helix transcriptional regulator, partial [Natronoarchaeum mannanilyticum]
DGEAAGVAGAAANASDADDGAADSGDEIDPELLSDEERVERLLRENGGRMKQASIVTETGWSNAKVSQLLSSMDEEGRVDKLRIGRENLISLPDEDVTEVE